MKVRSYQSNIRFVVLTCFLLGIKGFEATAQTIYEAESAILSGPTVGSTYGGYTGSGYADYVNASGDYVEFAVNAATAGTNTLQFRYANGGTGSRPLELKVNGVVVNSSLAFPATGGWSTWALTANSAVNLNAGNNTVRITAIGSSGGNVDHLEVTVGAPPPPNTSIVDLAESIDGFGFSDGWSGTLSSAKNNALYGTLGLTIFRAFINPNAGDYVTPIANITAAHAAGATVFATGWADRSWGDGSGHLLTSRYGDYANWLQSEAASKNIDYISPFNEPDGNPATQIRWTPTEILNFIKNNAPAIGKPILMPEAISFNDQYSDPVLNDPVAVNNVAIVAGHFYGNGNYVHANALNKGKPVWQTEHIIANSATDITAAMTFAKEVSDAMNNQFSAYCWWWVRDSVTDGSNLVLNDGTIFKNGYVLGQFAKFIRPGYVRVGATYNPSANVYVTAYKSSSNVVIVAINTGTSAASPQIAISGGTVSSVTPYRTSGTEGISTLSDIAVSGGVFSPSLPGQSVTTFVGSTGAPLPPPNPPTGLSASAVSSSQIDLGWTASSGATSYNVKRGAGSGGPYTTIAPGVTATSYSDTGLSPSTTYYYVVSALNANGESANSTQANATTQADTIPPTAPTGLTATAGDNSVALNWADNTEADLASYNVKCATVSGGAYTTIATGVATSAYTDSTAVNGTTYYYVVSAVDTSSNESANGNEASATPTAAPPTFVAAGAISSGTATITPALPAGIASGDVLLLFVETANEAVSISNPNGGTWTGVTGSPQGTGTAASTSATRLTAFWSRFNGTQGAPTVSDSGNHQIARMIAIRGAAASGNPWDVTAGGVEATADTSGSIPGATTTVANTLVVVAGSGSAPDLNGTSNFSSWANGNLTSLTERTDDTRNPGNGGAIGIATGVKAAAGAYGNTTVTYGSSAVKGMISIAIKK